ncbi:MAG: undecaprenyldiphospho-muramoylpentapeptide beta-N-acetylglucosaminyltransferase [Rhizobiaceae bacterium]
MTKTILLSAGGTGGHLFPAQALAQEMARRGWRVHLATDPRAKKFVTDFPADEVHIIKSATITGKNPIALGRTAFRLLSGYFASRRVIKKIKPDVVVGFGGYPTVPPLLAANMIGLPTILHEQNAVMGRANKFLASKVSAIATGFDLRAFDQSNSAPIVVTGNPLRAIAHEAAKHAYVTPTKSGPFSLLVFGGSQGARFFSQVIPSALALMEPTLRNRMQLTIQARPEDAGVARDALKKLNVSAQVEEFFLDMPHRISQSHLVICRSGASSVAELALIGRPSILVPLPGALDDDQGANAEQLEKAGGGVLIRQKDLSPERLAKVLSSAMAAPEILAKQAKDAKKAGVPDAAQRLAELVVNHV